MTIIRVKMFDIGKVYVLINENCEGSNFHGVFDSREAAQAAADALNKAMHDNIDSLFADDPEERKKQHEHADWWSKVEVVERNMNEVTK